MRLACAAVNCTFAVRYAPGHGSCHGAGHALSPGPRRPLVQARPVAGLPPEDTGAGLVWLPVSVLWRGTW